MAKPYSEDLRERVVRAVERGRSRREVARLFGVSASFVIQLMRRFRATGSVKPAKFGGHKKPALAGREETVRALVAAAPSATLAELQRQLSERGIIVGRSSIDRFLKRLRLSFKKNSLRRRAATA
jgi:putative transposase